MKPALAVVVALAAGCFSDGPVGMFPGGALRSEATDCPGSASNTDRTRTRTRTRTNWERFEQETESELEVHPEHSCPRSVRTWNLVHDAALYVPADFLTPIKRWPYQVLDDPNVRIRIGGETFACRATRVEDAKLIDALREHAARKYEIDPHSRAAQVEVWWFRLEPRGAHRTPVDVDGRAS